MPEKTKYISLSDKDLEDGKKLKNIFENLSETGKIMATVYLSALRDKEMAEEKAG